MKHIDHLLNEVKWFTTHKELKSRLNGEGFNMFRI